MAIARPGLLTATGKLITLAALLAVAAAIYTVAAASTSQVQVELEGEIPVACGITSSSGTFDFRAALTGAPQSMAMGVDCNVPYTLIATSQNGALTSDAAAAPGITNKVAYDLRVAVPTTGGGQVNLACASEQLATNGSCATATSGNEISVGQSAALTMTLNTDSKVLAAGDYGDVIVVQVLPRT